jgi:hypothetical protein
MTFTRPAVWAAVSAALAAAGCVDRRFVIESNVPTAQVYIDDRWVGPAPAYAPFEYYGFYTIKIVQPGFETLEKRVHVAAPWYAYPPFDFLAEVVWPFRITDRRGMYFELQPAQQARTEELIEAADRLRERGWNLPAPSEPSRQPAAPVIGPPVPPGPAPQPLAPPGLVPSVQPPSGYTPQLGGTFLK